MMSGEQHVKWKKKQVPQPPRHHRDGQSTQAQGRLNTHTTSGSLETRCGPTKAREQAVTGDDGRRSLDGLVFHYESESDRCGRVCLALVAEYVFRAGGRSWTRYRYDYRNRSSSRGRAEEWRAKRALGVHAQSNGEVRWYRYSLMV
jgi:hypothetical protein